jgi:hypothetical protein
MGGADRASERHARSRSVEHVHDAVGRAEDLISGCRVAIVRRNQSLRDVSRNQWKYKKTLSGGTRPRARVERQEVAPRVGSPESSRIHVASEEERAASAALIRRRNSGWTVTAGPNVMSAEP